MKFINTKFSDSSSRTSTIFQRGSSYFYGDEAENIAAFFVDSALNSGVTLPPHFLLAAGEILFGKSQINEVRLGGEAHWGSTLENSVLTAPWQSSPAPSITLTTEFDVAWEEVEDDEEFIAVFKFKDEMLLTWNIGEENLTFLRESSNPAAEQIFSAIEESESSKNYSSSSKTGRRYVTEIDENIRNYIADFDSLIIDSLSSDNSGLFNLSFSDEFGTVAYTFVQQRIREELGEIIAATIDSSPAAVKNAMEEFGIDEKQAREYIEVQKLINIKNFIRDGLPKFKERIERIIADTLVSLRREGTTLAAVDYRGKENDAYANEVKGKGFDEATSNLRKRWEIKSGTPTGKREVSEKKKIEDLQKRYKTVAGAIKDLYRQNFEKTRDENAAEKAVTMQAVAATLNKTPQTIQIYVKSMNELFGQADFERADVSDNQASAYALFRVIKAKVLEENHR